MWNKIHKFYNDAAKSAVKKNILIYDAELKAFRPETNFEKNPSLDSSKCPPPFLISEVVRSDIEAQKTVKDNYITPAYDDEESIDNMSIDIVADPRTSAFDIIDFATSRSKKYHKAIETINDLADVSADVSIED